MSIYTKKYEAGLSLIELMISITLGLLITAAAVQMLVTSQTSVSAQQAGSDIQNDGVFGIDTVVRSIRMANFGAQKIKDQPAQIMNDETPGGGIVLTVKTDTTATPKNVMVKTSTAVAAKLKSGEDPSQVSNLAEGGSGLKTDVLTVQRFTRAATFDCEGKSVAANRHIVERYYVEEDEVHQDNEPTALALKCKSANYQVIWKDSGGNIVTANTPNATKEYSYAKSFDNQKGVVLINRVDYFRVLLGVDNNTLVEAKRVDPAKNKKAHQYVPSSVAPDQARLNYMTVGSYMGLSVKPQIASVKLGFVVRSSNPSNAGAKNADQTFDVLDKTGLKLSSTVAQKANYQRQVYEKTVYIRNARG